METYQVIISVQADSREDAIKKFGWALDLDREGKIKLEVVKGTIVINGVRGEFVQ